MQTVYTRVKVNNEVEFCEIYDLDTKAQIEKVLLHNRISYYIKWPKPKLFDRQRVLCILCINEYFREIAETGIKVLGEDMEGKYRLILRKSPIDFF